MEYQKIINLLNETIYSTKLPRYATEKWIEIYDQSNGTCNQNKDIRFKIPQLRSDLCGFNDDYIIVTGKITVTGLSPDAYGKSLALKNSAPFYSCITRVNEKLIEDVKDLDIVMPMYNLLYFSKNYRKTTGSFWNYYRDEPNSGYDSDNNRTRIDYTIINSKSFDYKTSITGKLPNNENDLENIKIVIPLKNVSKLFMNLDIPLLNSEI